MSALDMNTNINRDRQRQDLAASGRHPQADGHVSIYTAYSISYLPASGDQFSALNDGTLILQPQKFENTEVGVKWNINPKLLFSRRSTTSTAPTSRSPTATASSPPAAR